MRAAAAVLALCLLAAPAMAGDALWTVAIVGRRDVVMTVRVGSDGMPSADAHLLGPELSLSVSSRNDVVAIRDANGAEWQTTSGSLRLDGPIGSRTLSSPVVVMQDAVYLPLDSIALLAGRRLVLEERGRAMLVPMTPGTPSRGTSPAFAATNAVASGAGGAAGAAAGAATGAGAGTSAGASAAGDIRVPDGWESFSLPKTADERRMSSDALEQIISLHQQPTVADVMPARHETLGLDLGLGFAQGGGAAFDISGSGLLAGYRVSVASFLTSNLTKATVRSGRVTVESPSNKWTTEAGDLLSEMRGLASGVRLSRRIGARWRPGVSLYANDPRVAGDRAAVSYRDDLLVTRNIDVRGEVSTDGSRFGAVRLIKGRGNVETFYRHVPARSTTDHGVSVSLNLWSGLSAYGGARMSDGAARERWNMVGIAVPLLHGSTMSLEESRTSRLTGNDTARTFGLQLPFGPVRMIQRYTWADVAMLAGPSVLESGRRQLQSMATWAPTSRLRFTYQMGTQWLDGSTARQWTELESVVRLSNRTSLQAVTGFPSVSDRERLRIGLQHQLPRGFRLSVEYGHLPAFQSRTLTAPDHARLLTMVRHTWNVRTPAAGATVEGVVRDDSGAPVPGAVVSLGRYLTTTREDGRYRFEHVPTGEHLLALDREHLPASYAAATDGRRIVLSGSERAVQADLTVKSLRAIHGTAYIDRNGNGRFDYGEGQAGVVIRLDNGTVATLTSDSGDFAFYNLEPGHYAVWVDRARLRSDLETRSTDRRTIELSPDAAAVHVDFELGAHDKPIFMKELP